MYAIVKTGGKQYMVEQGNKISVEKLNVAEGDTVSLEVVLCQKTELGKQVMPLQMPK